MESPQPKRKRGRPPKNPPQVVYEEDGDTEEEVPQEFITRRRGVSRVQREMYEGSEETLRDWFQRIGGDTEAMELKVFRVKPEVWDGQEIKGYLGTFTETINEDVVRERYGGGTYKLILYTADPVTGSPRFFSNRYVSIPGAPRMKDLVNQSPKEHSSEDPSVSAQALNMVREFALKGQQPQRANGQDAAMLQTIVEMMRMSQKDRDELQSKVFDIINRPKEDHNGQLLNTLLTQESARIQAIESNHASELRMLKENQREELKRIEDRYERQIATLQAEYRMHLEELRRSKDSEISRMDESKKNEIRYADLAKQAIIETQNREIERLNRELTKVEAEVAALKARKDQSPLEKAEEITGMMEAMRAIGLGGGDDEPKGKFDKLLDAVTSPAIINRVLGAAAPQPQQAAPLQPPGLKPFGDPFQGPDGNTYVPFEDDDENVFLRDPAGQFHQLSKKDSERFRAAQEEETEPAQEGPTDEQVLMAVNFIESAMAGRTEPEILAVSAKAVIPQTLIQYLEKVGADEFISRAVALKPESRLKSQAGRDYVRKVAESLLG